MRDQVGAEFVKLAGTFKSTIKNHENRKSLQNWLMQSRSYSYYHLALKRIQSLNFKQKAKMKYKP